VCVAGHLSGMQQCSPGTDVFELRIADPLNPNRVVVRPFLDLPAVPDEKERGRTEQHRFDFQGTNLDMSLVEGRNIFISILGDDAWLPSSIWAIGEDVNGTIRLLAARPRWPTSELRGWFSREPGEGRATRSLDEQGGFFIDSDTSRS
jgi:hypothetical protein